MEIVSVNKLTDYKWINLFDVTYKNKKGDDAHWTFASRKANPVPSNLPIKADAVVIIPIHKQGKERRLVVTKEFRIPLGDYEYGFPAGLFDGEESAVDAAARELAEETGFKLTKVLYISESCVSSAGLSDEAVKYVVCECTGETSSEGNELSEDITVTLLDCDEIEKLIESGNKISAKALPWYLMFLGAKKIKWPKNLTKKYDKVKKIKKGSRVKDVKHDEAKTEIKEAIQTQNETT